MAKKTTKAARQVNSPREPKIKVGDTVELIEADSLRLQGYVLRLHEDRVGLAVVWTLKIGGLMCQRELISSLKIKGE